MGLVGLAAARPLAIAGPSRLGRAWRAGAITLGLVAMLAGLADVVNEVHRNPAWRTATDYGIYLRAGEAVASKDNPYDVKVPAEHGTFHGYGYPPGLATAMAGYQLLPESPGRYGWSMLQAGALGAAILVLLRGFRQKLEWHWVALALGAAFLAHSTRNHLYHGQFTFPLVLALALALWLYARRRDGATGIALGLMFAVKPFYGPVLLYFLWRRSYRVAWSAVATATVVTSVGFLAIAPAGIDAIRGWFAANRNYSSEAFVTSPWTHSAYGLLLRLFAANPYSQPWTESRLLLMGGWAAVGAALVGMAAAGLGSRRVREHRERWMIVEVSLLVAAAMTFGPLTEGEHLPVLIPGASALLLIAVHERPRGIACWVAVVAWVGFMALLFPPVQELTITGPDMVISAPSGLAILWTGRVTALLALCVITAVLALRSGRTLARGEAKGPLTE